MERVLVTGASGSIGTALIDKLLEWEHSAIRATDKDTMDVRRADEVAQRFAEFMPTLVFHLAGAKHAPLGEEDPLEAAAVNITGTHNVLQAAFECDARVVTASTCKACNPETAYGATKLIAERMTLNAGGSVARFYNVRESCGNVFELWSKLPEDFPIPVTPCKRRFMSLEEAVRLLMFAAVAAPGRYTIAGKPSETMASVAKWYYPRREQVEIPPRRGDRLEEPEYATQETAFPVELGMCQILSPHDADIIADLVAA